MALWRAMAASALVAFAAPCADFRGVVQVSGLPLPGATVTASRAAARHTTITGDDGSFVLDLPEGDWEIEVQSFGFAPLRRSVAAGSAAVSWELTFLSPEALKGLLAAGSPTPKPEPASPPAAPSRPAPAGARQRPQPGTAPARAAAGFQRTDVTQVASTEAFENTGALRGEEANDLSQSAANSFLVQGSVSSAVGLPQQFDWGLRPGMEGMGPGGMFGPGVGPDGAPFGAQSGMGQDGPPPGMGGPGAMGGLGGRPGAPGPFGGMLGRPGGGPGMGPGLGGGGGPGGGGGAGRPGGAGGGDRRAAARPGAARANAGAPPWAGRGGATAFGNNRRDRRLQYNGMAVYSLNDSAWDARQYSVTGANLAKPDWSRMRGNVMFGGPLRIPRLISAEKMILFTVNYQYSRNRTGTISDAVNMPTALERAGDFSQTAVNNRPVTIYDPATGTPFAGNQIPESRLDARALGLASFLPMPNLPLAVRNYQTSWVGANDSHNFNARVMNIRLGSKDRLNGGIGFQRSSSQSPNLFQFVDEGAGSGVNASLMWSRTIRAGVINSANLAFSRARQEAIPFFAFERNVAGELGIPGVSALPQNWGPPTLRFVNYAGLSDGNYSLNRNQTFSVGDTLLWTKGTHTRSVGVNFRRFQTNRLSDTNGRGTWSFNGIATSTALNGAAIPGAGYDFADFLLGYATTSNIRYGNPDQYFRSSSWDIHANDDWRVHPKFTVNYGVRWDYALPVTELYGRLVNLASANGFATVNQVTPGGVLPDALVYPDRNNFSPRVGFAFRPRLNNSLVIRGGYGVYYNTSVYNIIAANMAQQPPFAQVLNASGSRLQPLSLANGFAIAPGAAGLGTYAIDPYYRIGYAQTWTVSVQRDLPRGLFATVGYLGTKGTRLDQQYIPNSSAPGLPQSTLPTGFAFQNSNGNSIYHAAQFQLNRRFRSGFGANTSYQWSKSIDNAGTGGRGQGGTPVAQNWLDYAAERGLSSFDARHNLSVQAQYSTAMGVRGGTLLQGWKGKLFKDWTVGSTLTFRSGNPFTATVRSQVQGTSVNNTVRADATGLPIDAPGMLFNTAAFAQPQAGRWGTAGRNTIPGPGALYLNGSVGRVIRFDEKRTLDLQMQGQNVLNRVVITQWGTVVGALNYGVASNAAAMRRLTLNARFRF